MMVVGICSGAPLTRHAGAEHIQHDILFTAFQALKEKKQQYYRSILYLTLQQMKRLLSSKAQGHKYF